MNRKLAQGRHVERLQSSPHCGERDLGEPSDHQLMRSGAAVLLLLRDMVERSDVSDAWPWPTPRA
jgi:hypothetical protein